MKVLLSVALLVTLAAACKQSQTAPESAAAPAASPGAAAPLAAPPAQPFPQALPLPAQLPAVIATVNSEPVERWELEAAIKAVEGRVGSPIPPDRRNEIVRGLIDQLVAFHVLAQEAHARKLDPTDAELAERLGQYKGGFDNDGAFQQALAAQGMTLDQLKKQTHLGLRVSKVVDAEITSRIAVPDADVERFYKENTDRFKQGESVHASHILIGLPKGADTAQKQQAQAKAEQVLKQVKGADFAKLAREHSQDSSAANGGDLGFFPQGQMEPTFEKAAFALKPGDTSGIVETPFGFHIIKVHERRPPRTATLAEVGGQIKAFLTDEQRQQKMTAFVDQAKARMKIEILV